MEFQLYSVSGLFLRLFQVRSVGLSVGNERVLRKNGQLDRNTVCSGGSSWSREPCIICRSRSSRIKVNFKGKWEM